MTHPLNDPAKLALLGQAIDEAHLECLKAMTNWPPFNSAHEGYGVLQEEMAELFDEVRLKQSKRDVAAMRRECVQIAAMAMRMAVEVCNEETIRK